MYAGRSVYDRTTMTPIEISDIPWPDCGEDLSGQARDVIESLLAFYPEHRAKADGKCDSKISVHHLILLYRQNFIGIALLCFSR